MCLCELLVSLCLKKKNHIKFRFQAHKFNFFPCCCWFTGGKGNTAFLLFSGPFFLLHSSPWVECLGYVNVFHHSVDLPGLPKHVIAFLSLPLALSLICPNRPPLPTCRHHVGCLTGLLAGYCTGTSSAACLPQRLLT